MHTCFQIYIAKFDRYRIDEGHKSVRLNTKDIQLKFKLNKYEDINISKSKISIKKSSYCSYIERILIVKLLFWILLYLVMQHN